MAVNPQMGQTSRTLGSQQLDRRITQVTTSLLNVGFSSHAVAAVYLPVLHMGASVLRVPARTEAALGRQERGTVERKRFISLADAGWAPPHTCRAADN